MIGLIKTSEYFFVIDDAESKYDFGATQVFESLDFDCRLLRAAEMQSMRGKPIASWLVARLAFLTDGRIGVYDGETQSCDGGTITLAALVYTAEQVCIGELQIQADDNIAIFGKCLPLVDSGKIIDCFAKILTEVTESVKNFTLYVRDTERGSKRTYGYNQGRFLGRQNVE